MKWYTAKKRDTWVPWPQLTDQLQRHGFAVCVLTETRQRAPFAVCFLARHGKELGPRRRSSHTRSVPSHPKFSASKFPSSNSFVVCQENTHGKVIVYRVYIGNTHVKQVLCRVYFPGTRQRTLPCVTKIHTANGDFAVCISLTHGKGGLCRVYFPGARQILEGEEVREEQQGRRGGVRRPPFWRSTPPDHRRRSTPILIGGWAYFSVECLVHVSIHVFELVSSLCVSSNFSVCSCVSSSFSV